MNLNTINLKDSSDIAVGLDIGTTKIVCVVGRKNAHNKLEILAIGRAKSLGVHRGVVNNIKKTIASIEEAVGAAQRQLDQSGTLNGFKIREVTVGIAGQHIRSIHHSDYIIRENYEDMIDENDIERLKDQVYKLTVKPGEEIIHVLPQEYKVDSQNETHDPIGLCGSRLEANFHVVVAQVTHITNIGRCVRQAGLTLAGLVLEPIASSEAVLFDEEKEAGVALIDIGGGTTDLAVFKDNVIRHTSVVPFGGNVITEDIKIECSIIEKYAELMKVKFGSAWPDSTSENEIISIPSINGREPKEISKKKLAQIISSRMREIIKTIYDELKDYGCNEQRKKLIAGLVVTGGGANLEHLRQLFEYVTGMDVRIGNSHHLLASGTPQELTKPEYATALGLLLHGLEELNHWKADKDVIKSTNVSFQTPTQLMEEVAAEKIRANSPTKSSLKKEKKNGFFSHAVNRILNFLNENE